MMAFFKENFFSEQVVFGLLVRGVVLLKPHHELITLTAAGIHPRLIKMYSHLIKAIFISVTGVHAATPQVGGTSENKVIVEWLTLFILTSSWYLIGSSKLEAPPIILHLTLLLLNPLIQITSKYVPQMNVLYVTATDCWTFHILKKKGSIVQAT